MSNVYVLVLEAHHEQMNLLFLFFFFSFLSLRSSLLQRFSERSWSDQLSTHLCSKKKYSMMMGLFGWVVSPFGNGNGELCISTTHLSFYTTLASATPHTGWTLLTSTLQLKNGENENRGTRGWPIGLDAISDSQSQTQSLSLSLEGRGSRVSIRRNYKWICINLYLDF